MPGIENITNLNMGNITYIANLSSGNPIEFFVKVNDIVYNGWLYFILLWVLWIILFISANRINNQIPNNAMYALAFTTLVSLLLRAIEIIYAGEGIAHVLISDPQNYIFPLLTIVIATILWATKRS